jgi:hypothetical protein
MSPRLINALLNLYGLIWFGTFVFLTFFDHYQYNLWNWIIALPVNVFLGAIWPIYWLILHWVFK